MDPLPLPGYIQLYPTVRCNQRCSFCFNTGQVQHDLPSGKALELLDILLNNGISELDIMGGEPFVLPWMPSYLHTAVRKGIMVNISTNGSFPELMETFSGLSPKKINIGVSLEASTAQAHNRLTNSHNFEKTLRSINTLVLLGLDPIVKTVVSRSTMQDIRNIVSLLEKLGVQRYYVIHQDTLTSALCNQQTAISYHEFLVFHETIRDECSGMQIGRVNASCFERHALPEGMRCAGGVKKLSVMPDGSVYPCNLFQHVRQFNAGNIFIDNFTDIWSSPKLAFFRKFKINRCRIRDCPNHSSCTGGCPAHGYYLNKDLDGSDIRCRNSRNYILMTEP